MIPAPPSTSYLLALFAQLSWGDPRVDPEVEEPLPPDGGLPGSSGLIVIALAVLTLYFIACCWWPFVSCPHPRCEGGKHRSPSGKAWRPCWWCKGKGSRVRWGRRLYEHMTGRRKHT